MSNYLLLGFGIIAGSVLAPMIWLILEGTKDLFWIIFRYFFKPKRKVSNGITGSFSQLLKSGLRDDMLKVFKDRDNA